MGYIATFLFQKLLTYKRFNKITTASYKQRDEPLSSGKIFSYKMTYLNTNHLSLLHRIEGY
jgi:hypothetical protein